MMRIPLFKVYRAFPELDRFPDEECERFVKRARRTQLKWMWIPLLTAPVVFVLVVIAMVAIGRYLDEELRQLSLWIDRTIGRVFPDGDYSVGELLIAGGALLAVTVGPWLGFAVPRDMVLRRAIAKRLDVAACNGCDHSLLGLPLLAEVERPAVRCPECGQVMVLEEIGLTAEDVIVREERA